MNNRLNRELLNEAISLLTRVRDALLDEGGKRVKNKEINDFIERAK